MANVLHDRDNRILEAAIELAKADHFQFITREQVAAKAECGLGTINSAYGTMRGLKRAVLRAAVERGIVEIVAQGLAERHEIVMAAPAELRSAAALHMAA